MDFGKLHNVDRVRFSLPDDDFRGIEVLSSLKKASSSVFIGAPIWACPAWAGKIYPSKAPARDNLLHYAQKFNTIELNTTFYRIPDALTVARWQKAVAPGFKFAPKLFQGISHALDLAPPPGLIDAFCSAILALGPSLGPCFMQLPPQFSPSQIASLDRFLREFPLGLIKLFIEFRHPAWFENQKLQSNLFDLLKKYQVGAVITDVAGRRDVLHTSLPISQAMVRFVGNKLHPSDYTRIDDWVQKISGWVRAGLQELYFFVHQPDSVEVPELSSYLIEKLNQACGLDLKAWDTTFFEQEQMRLF